MFDFFKKGKASSTQVEIDGIDGTCVVNGVVYKGNNVSVRNGVVYVDGVKQTGENLGYNVTVEVKGNCGKITTAGAVTVTGNSEDIRTTGSVHVGGNAGSGQTTGSVTVGGDVSGNVQTTGRVTITGKAK